MHQSSPSFAILAALSGCLAIAPFARVAHAASPQRPNQAKAPTDSRAVVVPEIGIIAIPPPFAAMKPFAYEDKKFIDKFAIGVDEHRPIFRGDFHTNGFVAAADARKFESISFFYDDAISAVYDLDWSDDGSNGKAEWSESQRSGLTVRSNVVTKMNSNIKTNRVLVEDRVHHLYVLVCVLDSRIAMPAAIDLACQIAASLQPLTKPSPPHSK